MDWERIRAGHYRAAGNEDGKPYEYMIMKLEKGSWRSYDELNKNELGYVRPVADGDTLSTCKHRTEVAHTK